MKAKQSLISVAILLLYTNPAWSQGTLTFIYDQQSAMENFAEGGTTSIKNNQPVGQSFTPTLSSVGFVRFYLYDSSGAHNQGAVLNVVLRSDSISGSILGTSDVVTLPANSGGYDNFFFSTPVSVTPGTTYYFQPIMLSGDQGMGAEMVANYPGGTAIFQGSPLNGNDFWFREGVVVPEPSTWALLLLGGGVLVWRKSRRPRETSDS